MFTTVRRVHKLLWSTAVCLLCLVLGAGIVHSLAAAERQPSRPQPESCDQTISGSFRQGSAQNTSFLPMVASCLASTPTPTPDPWTNPPVAIEVFSPITDSVYHSPIEIIGYSRTFEGNVLVRLRDSKGDVIAERHTQGGSTDGFDFFHTRLRFYINAEQDGLVEVYETSAKDGSELHKVTIPVVLLPGQREIDIDYPAVGQAVCAPVGISGYSNTYEAHVNTLLANRNGSVVQTQHAMGGNLGMFGIFSVSLPYTVTVPQPMVVGASGTSGRELGPIDETRIPISVYNCSE